MPFNKAELKRQRVLAGLSQHDLAVKTSRTLNNGDVDMVRADMIASYESTKNTRQPNIDTYFRLVLALAVEPMSLWQADA